MIDRYESKKQHEVIKMGILEKTGEVIKSTETHYDPVSWDYPIRFKSIDSFISAQRVKSKVGYELAYREMTFLFKSEGDKIRFCKKLRCSNNLQYEI